MEVFIFSVKSSSVQVFLFGQGTFVFALFLKHQGHKCYQSSSPAFAAFLGVQQVATRKVWSHLYPHVLLNVSISR